MDCFFGDDHICYEEKLTAQVAKNIFKLFKFLPDKYFICFYNCFVFSSAIVHHYDFKITVCEIQIVLSVGMNILIVSYTFPLL